MKNLSSMFTSFDDDNDSDFEMDVGTGKLTLYAQMDSSFQTWDGPLCIMSGYRL